MHVVHVYEKLHVVDTLWLVWLIPGEHDLDRLLPLESEQTKDAAKADSESSATNLPRSGEETGSNGVRAALESLSTHDSPAAGGSVPESMETQDTTTAASAKPPDGATKSPDKQHEKRKVSPQLQTRIRHIKPLLNVTSRLGKALSELFGLLVKLSVGSPVRQRRAQLNTAPAAPTPAARNVAGAVTKLLATGLKWEPPTWSPVPKLQLTFYICSTGFIAPMLFDEKKNPYHLMLQKFVASGGLEAMFAVYHWALTAGGKSPPGGGSSGGTEHPELPDGTGEFLDSWLLLVEKMVCVKSILESPHTITAQPGSGLAHFSPIHFLVLTHRMAFDAVMLLWGKSPLKTFGRWMSESILVILCEIIKGQTVIKVSEQLYFFQPTSRTHLKLQLHFSQGYVLVSTFNC